MMLRYAFAFSRRDFARVVDLFPPIKRRAWGMPDAQCTRSLVGKTGSKRSPAIVTTSTPETPSIPRAMVLQFTSCSPRRSGSFATVAPADMTGPRPVGPTSPPQDLTPASRCQDHTTSLSASPVSAKRLRRGPMPSSARPLTAHGSFANPPCRHVACKHCRVHRIPFRVIDVAQRPSVGRDNVDVGCVATSEKQNIFAWRA